MLPRNLRHSLLAVELVAALTLIRSVAYDRWITVLASVLLLIGASAGLRGRAWGVALAFGQAIAFPVAWAIGIAPAWFCLVGLVGVLPFALTSRAFARFDTGATALLAAAAASVGALGAIMWKEVAWSIFRAVPALRPSIEAQHGLLVAALVAATAYGTRAHLLRARREGGARVRVGDRVRVADAAESAAMDEIAADLEAAEPTHAAEARRARSA